MGHFVAAFRAGEGTVAGRDQSLFIQTGWTVDKWGRARLRPDYTSDRASLVGQSLSRFGPEVGVGDQELDP